MRVLPIILALACLGCTEHPTAGEKAIISEVEKLVALPRGGGELKCYERYYTILQRKDAEKYLGTTLDLLDKHDLLVGQYRIGDNPGIYWKKNTDKFPMIYDAGCGVINVLHLIGIQEKSIPVICSFDIAGDIPEEITPPVTC